MTLTPLTGGLLAVGVFIAATIVWNLTKTKRRIAGANGPNRYPRSINSPSRKVSRSSKGGLKAVAIWGTAVALIAWVALSLANPSKPDPSEAQAQEAATPPESPSARSSVVIARLTPPPQPETASSTSIAIPSPYPAATMEPSPGALATAQAGALLTPESQAPQQQLVYPLREAGQANMLNAALAISIPSLTPYSPLSAFAPEDLVFDANNPGIVRQAAANMAPNISRMEPIGRSLQEEKDRATKILAPPPARPRLAPPPKNPLPDAPTEADSKPARPMLTPPTPPLSNLTSGGPVSYIVLLGSFITPEYAERLRAKMVDNGLPVTVAEVTDKNNKVWYRVMSGAFDTQKEAESYSQNLKQRNLVEKTVIFKSSN
ncbi:MAG: SPOR domain-containing protein [Deltaproteobacteria bacterium]|nr:SPOR domain-containing protein [Deltaproteobacteria bacterium]